MKVFITTVNYIDPEDYQLMKKGEDMEINSTEECYFSSLDKAVASLKEEIQECDPEYAVLRAVVSEIEMDNKDQASIIHFYDKDLNYLGVFDFDQVTEQSQYHKGDWVLFMKGGSLICGLVDASPEGSEVGLVIYEDKNLNDCSPHDHTKEINFLTKITEARAKELLPRKYFEGIKRRFREYNPAEE